MNLTVIDNHSVALELLTRGPVLDAGCRGFRFMSYFAGLGHPVVGLDPSPDIQIPADLMDREMWGHFYAYALVAPGHPPRAMLRMTDDAEARYVTPAGKEGDPWIQCITLSDLTRDLKLAMWDLVKLNVEGAEYDILAAWPGPVARQIVVSFHEHTDRRRGDAAIERIIEHLGKWYKPIRHEKDVRYCAGANFWDSVFCLKGLM